MKLGVDFVSKDVIVIGSSDIFYDDRYLVYYKFRGGNITDSYNLIKGILDFEGCVILSGRGQLPDFENVKSKPLFVICECPGYRITYNNPEYRVEFLEIYKNGDKQFVNCVVGNYTMFIRTYNSKTEFPVYMKDNYVLLSNDSYSSLDLPRIKSLKYWAKANNKNILIIKGMDDIEEEDFIVDTGYIYLKEG